MSAFGEGIQQSCKYVQVSSQNKSRHLARKFSSETVYFVSLLSLRIRLKTWNGVAKFQSTSLMRSLLVRFLKMYKLFTIVFLAILAGGATAQQQVWGQCQLSPLLLPCYF